MDVAGGFVLFAALVAVLWLADVMVQRRREQLARAYRRLQVRKVDMWWWGLDEREALAAMRRVADDVDREAKP